MDKVTGGCLWRSARAVGEPVIQLFCYCTDCRRVSGTDGYAAYIVQRADLNLDQGEPSSYSVTAKSGRTNTRNFCATVGFRSGPI